MQPQNVNGATSKPTAASAQTNSALTVPQVYDLFCYVKAVCGRSTGTIEQPVVPAGAEELFADFGDFDTIDITGREGLALAIVADDDEMPATARRYVERAMGIPGAIILFRCQSPETAERLMQHLHAEYQLTLVREPAEPDTSSAQSDPH